MTMEVLIHNDLLLTWSKGMCVLLYYSLHNNIAVGGTPGLKVKATVKLLSVLTRLNHLLGFCFQCKLKLRQLHKILTLLITNSAIATLTEIGASQSALREEGDCNIRTSKHHGDYRVT